MLQGASKALSCLLTDLYNVIESRKVSLLFLNLIAISNDFNRMLNYVCCG